MTEEENDSEELDRPERKQEWPDGFGPEGRNRPVIEGAGGCCETWEALSTKREEDREEEKEE